MNEKRVMEFLCEYERKLEELMGRDAYLAWSKGVAIKLFLNDVNDLPDEFSDFKAFVLEHFDEITEGWYGHTD